MVGVSRSPKIGGVGHFGLVGMRERATSVGGTFSIRSMPGKGTVVRLEAPYRA
jgi:signal transduction histidine kinase